MSRRKRNKQPPQVAPPATLRSTFPVARAQGWLLAGLFAVLVAQVLLPSESQPQRVLPLVMLLLALGAAWSLVAMLGKGSKLVFGWVDGLLLGMFAWIAIAGMIGSQTGAPRPALNALWNWIGLAVAYFLARQLVTTATQRNAVAVVMIALAAAAGGHGLYQVFHELPQTRAEYRADPDGMLRAAGQWSPEGSAQRAAFEARLDSPEPIAMFALTNSLAGLLVAWGIVATGAALYWIRQFREPSDQRLNWHSCLPAVGLAIALLCIGWCLALTQSRSGYVAAVVGLATLGFIWWQDTADARHRRRAVWIASIASPVVVALIAMLAFLLRGHPIVSDAGKSLGYRLEYWHATSEMIWDHPLFGVGPGNFQALYSHYQLPQSSETIADPHNFLMEIASNAGLPAVVLLLAALGIVKWRILLPGTPPSTSSLIVEETNVADVHYCWIGGLSGVLLALLLGVLFVGLVIPMSLSEAVLYAIVGGTSGALLSPLVRLRLPRGVYFAALAALAVHLLASGGISFAGVAGTWWLLIVLCLAGETPGAKAWVVSPKAGLVLLLGFTSGVVACYFTAYSPVAGVAWRMDAADQRLDARDVEGAARLLEESQAIDPWAIEPLRTQAALQAATASVLDPQFEVRLARWHQLDPHAWQPRSQAGDWYMQAWRESEEQPLLASAIEHYEAAVERFPNGAIAHAQLAWALAQSDDLARAQRHAAEAIRLDGLNPHTERSLAGNQVRLTDPQVAESTVLDLMRGLTPPQ